MKKGLVLVLLWPAVVLGQVFHLVEGRALKGEAYAMMKELGYQGKNDLIDANEYAQKNFLRPTGKERWQIEDTPEIQKHGPMIRKALSSLGFFQSVEPKDVEYQNVLLLGAATTRMHHRVSYFRQFTKLKFAKLYFLTGQRPLDKSFEHSVDVPNIDGAHTESGAARLIFDHLVKSPKVKPIYVDTEGSRPTTQDTIIQWLKNKPRKGKTLIFSNNPYVPYQHSVIVLRLLDNKFISKAEMESIETVGQSDKPNNTQLRVLLDTFARTLFNEKLIVERYGY